VFFENKNVSLFSIIFSMLTYLFLSFLLSLALPTEAEYGLCLETCLPMRKTADHKSEQVSQIIFGDAYKVLQNSGDWSEIELAYDQYKGWIPKANITKIKPETYQKYTAGKWHVAVGKQNVLKHKGKTTIVPAGATLPFLAENVLNIEGKKYTFEGTTALPEALDKTKMLETAQSFLGVPYLWGGKSPAGWDCSGFVQMVGKMHGLKLLRDSYQQAEQGEKVSLKDAQAGDIAFFQRKPVAEGETKVIHVGIYLGNGKIIHANDMVSINTLDSIGIYRDDQRKYSHYLKFLRRH
jgi:cell wall-associated NlpC family hydrolase